ncbi:HlyD family secretion protein [Mucilaginibacter conchicola]|uniref:HlyD family secretion protein n=1 Tax=Mucilaginibacter conchicola TaxID=2303333 RepID=A0A372NQ14_9SPHI|nr:HlyD family secretion protein [Mucilaginibacter conchicola]RFZ90465.1 HlyD family secretion protein [Mucilaginibacter conchicola]
MNTSITINKTDKIITRVSGIIALLILCALMVWGAIYSYQTYRNEETNDAQVQEYINPVTSRVGGYINKIYYEENQDVKRGDTLLVIDNSEYQLQQQEAQSALANSKAQLNVLGSNEQTTQKLADVSKTAIAAAKARLLNKQQEYARYKKLFEAESATRQQLENIEAALAVAKSDYEASLQSYQSSLSKINDVSAQRAVLNADIKRKEALLNRAGLDMGYTVIKAPYNGKMGRRTVQEGQSIQAGQTLAFIVDRSSGKWVVANFKETQLADMREGDIAEIHADAYPNKMFKGEIVSIAGATGSSFSLLPPDNSSGNFVKIVQRVPVRIRLTQAADLIQPLRAGMNVSVVIPKDHGRN